MGEEISPSPPLEMLSTDRADWWAIAVYGAKWVSLQDIRVTSSTPGGSKKQHLIGLV